MVVLRHLIFICIILFVLNPSINTLKCYVCNSCKDPFDLRNGVNITTMNGFGYYCAKVWTKTYVRREISKFCPEFHVGGTGIWCCQTDLCNDGTKIISTIGLWISVIAGVLMKFCGC